MSPVSQKIGAKQQPEKTPVRSAITGDQFNARALLDLAVGPMRVILILIGVWIVFAAIAPNFLTALNFSNLVQQIAPIGLISGGVVLVILLGDIDLSVGAVSGLCASIMVVLNAQHHVPSYLAIAVAIGAGAGIGLVHGLIVTIFQLPSFMVTLAGLLVWQGAQLVVLGVSGNLNINDAFINNLSGSFLPSRTGWTLGLLAATLHAAVLLARRRGQTRAGVEQDNVVGIALRSLLVLVVVVVGIAALNTAGGVPLSFVLLLGIIFLLHMLITGTQFGRHVMAVGGNAEASRRVGISVFRIRIIAFILCDAMAAAGGVLAASRLQAVTTSSGGNTVLLLAIAGPVIAGVSLFGGRGMVWAAVLGALIIGSIQNGMALLSLRPQTQMIVTGIFLLFAIILDALARFRRRRTGAI